MDDTLGVVRIFDNAGDETKLFPNFATVVSTINTGVQQFTSGPLHDGSWVFGLRVFDGINEEPNTHSFITIRIINGVLVQDMPPKPILLAKTMKGGKISLLAKVPTASADGTATQVRFFTNDGAGGAVDFSTPLGTGFIPLTPGHEDLLARLETDVFGETARIFGLQAYNSDGVVSVNADEVTITPDNTAPPDVTNVVITNVRD